MMECLEGEDGSQVRRYLVGLVSEFEVLPPPEQPPGGAEGGRSEWLPQAGACFPFLSRGDRSVGPRRDGAKRGESTGGREAPVSASRASAEVAEAAPDTGGDGEGLAVPALPGTVRPGAKREASSGSAPAALPVVEVAMYPHIGYTVCKELRKAEQCIVGTAYCFDYSEGIRILSDKRRRSVSVRVLLDETQYKKPSCKRQPESISHLLEWGVEFRSYKPDRGSYAVMHAKSWVVDGATVITGSPNFTVNGMENSEELLTIIRNDDYISEYLAWFERIWRIADTVERGIPLAAASGTDKT